MTRDETRIELIIALALEQLSAATRVRIMRRVLVMLGYFEAAHTLEAAAGVRRGPDGMVIDGD